MLFLDRQDAGKQLAQQLKGYKNHPDVIVLALPRGGVVIGYEICKALNAPLDLILVRKLGVPWQEELALGAIATHHIKVINKDILATFPISQAVIDSLISKEQAELERRNRLYRKGKPFPCLDDKIVILADDGIATGATMKAAIKVAKTMHPQKIIVAVPLASSSIYKEMSGESVDLKVLETPEPFYGIGMWYANFPQLTDQEVIHILDKAHKKSES